MVPSVERFEERTLLSFALGLNFEGASLTDTRPVNIPVDNIPIAPPDTMGAIGPTDFAEFTNGTFSVYDKTTSMQVGAFKSLTGFWQDAGVTGLSAPGGGGAGTTDPHILYDPLSQRWYAVAIDTPSTRANSNRYLVAVSNTSDPTAGWKGFAIQNTSKPGTFADFPMVGIDQNALYVSTNNFVGIGGPPASTEGVLVVPKSDLLAGNVADAKQIANIDSNTTGRSPQPIVDYSGTGSTHLTLSSDLLDPSSLRFSTIRGVVNGVGNNPSITQGNSVPVSGNVNTQGAAQLGGPTIATNDNLFSSSVIKQGNYIWAVNTNTIGGHEALVWYRFDATTLSRLERGTISDSSHDYYYGSIAVNARGDVVIGYTRSGATEFASAYASVGFFDGTSTSFDSPTLLKSGTGVYNITGGGPLNRWGDYSQTTLDPNNPLAFWTIQEWASGDNVFAPPNVGEWHTQIAEINITQVATTTTLTSSPNPSKFGQNVTFTATVTPTGGTGTPTGTVLFEDGSTVLGSGTLSGGVATFSTSTLAVGSHSITAVYSGDGNFTTSTSPPLTQTVQSVIPPRVVNLGTVPGRHGVSTIRATFSKPLDPQRAMNLLNYGYSVQIPGHNHRLGAPSSILVGLEPAEYDAAKQTVTLTTITPIHRGTPILVLINQVTDNPSAGVGVADLDGILLDGNNDGIPGGVFMQTVSAGGPAVQPPIRHSSAGARLVPGARRSVKLPTGPVASRLL